jgi:hypothetical protein
MERAPHDEVGVTYRTVTGEEAAKIEEEIVAAMPKAISSPDCTGMSS